MDRPASWRVLGSLAMWALPILAGLVLAPAGARAGCGDYVTTRLSHPAAAASPRHDAPAAPSKPCHGPGCSHAPAAPLPSAPSAQPETPEEWGCATGGLALDPFDPTGTLPSHDERRIIRLPRRIFHPPRLAP